VSDDFLDLSDAVREQQREGAVDYAKLYLAAFVHNPAGARLLAEWEERVLRKPTPVNAPHTEYAANEAVRQFILGIKQQITLASTEGR
jgi:hypothetical protein